LNRLYLNGFFTLLVDVANPELTIVIGTPGPQFHFHHVSIEQHFLASKVKMFIILKQIFKLQFFSYLYVAKFISFVTFLSIKTCTCIVSSFHFYPFGYSNQVAAICRSNIFSFVCLLLFTFWNVDERYKAGLPNTSITLICG